MDALRRNAHAIAQSLPDDLRGAWLAWAADLADYLVHLDARIIDIRAMVQSLSDRMTILIHDAVRDAAAGNDLRVAAIDERLHAEIARISRMLDEATQQTARVSAALDAQTRHIDAQHLQVLSELMKINDRLRAKSFDDHTHA